MLAGAGFDLDRDRLAAWADAGSMGSIAAVHVEIVFLLPTVDIEPLAEISLVVIQPDADQRNAQIRGTVDMIAGQDTQTAGIDRQRFVQAEFRRKVSYGPRPQHAGIPRTPGLLSIADIPACDERCS